MPDKYSLICKKVKPHEIKNNLLFKQRSLLSMTVILIYDGRFIHFSGEKNLELFRRRKDLLDTFLSHNVWGYSCFLFEKMAQIAD